MQHSKRNINNWTSMIIKIPNFISGHRKGPHPPTNTTSMYEKKDNSCKQDILTDISFYIYRFMYRYTVLLYTTCTDELYFCVHNSYKRETHTHTHRHFTLYIWIPLQIYCTTVHILHRETVPVWTQLYTAVQLDTT
jgi:hypothetical protein